MQASFPSPALSSDANCRAAGWALGGGLGIAQFLGSAPPPLPLTTRQHVVPPQNTTSFQTSENHFYYTIEILRGEAPSPVVNKP